VFTRSEGVWSQQQKLTASDGAANDDFGVSVSINGDTAIVGARAHDTAAGLNSGSAYVFTRSAGVWTQQQKLTASDGAAIDLFGSSVAISSNTAIVGARADDTACPGNPNCNSGSAYLFIRAGATWTQQQKLTASDGAAQDFFGSSVTISGDAAIIGAYLDDTAAGADRGSAYCYRLLPLSPGDINGDGDVNIADLLAVISAWGPCPPPCPADVNQDGVVNIHDLLAVIANWG
jgi:hypothetical protein